MSKATKNVAIPIVEAIVAAAIGVVIGWLLGIWFERVYFLILLWMCFNYQRYMEIKVDIESMKNTLREKES